MVRKIQWLFFLCSICFTALSQRECKEWAPVGAKWQWGSYSFAGERFFNQVEVVKDTLIHDITFKKIETHAIFIFIIKDTPMLGYDHLLSTSYYGVRNDSLFKYHPKFKEPKTFFMAYNVDTIGFKFYPNKNACYQNNDFYYKLDTIIDKKWADFNFKMKIYSNSVNSVKDSVYSFYPYFVLYDISEYSVRNFAEDKTGHIKGFQDFRYPTSVCQDTGFMPFLRTDKTQEITRWFTCYYDKNVGYVDKGYGFCSLIDYFKSAIQEIPDNIKIECIQDDRSITIKNMERTLDKVALSDIYGRSFEKTNVQNNVIKFENLQTGIYFVLIYNKNQLIYRKSILKY